VLTIEFEICVPLPTCTSAKITLPVTIAPAPITAL
jgi:hypothetical protein